MADKTFYFNEEEMAFLSSQEPGYVRSLVRREMDGDAAPTAIESQIIKSTPVGYIMEPDKAIRVNSSNTPNTCKKCGVILSYYGAKCRYCK